MNPQPLNHRELLDAERLARSLHSSILRAKHFKQVKISLPLHEAEELTQLLFDSLRSIKGDISDDFTPTPMAKALPPVRQECLHLPSRSHG
jgi:hypothetical protein